MTKNAVKQLHDDSAHAGKEAWTELSFEDVGQCRIWVDLECLGLRVEVNLLRGEQHITAQ